MDQQRRHERNSRRWKDLDAEEKAEIDRALFKGVRVSPEYADLAADRAASVAAILSPGVWIASALTVLAVGNALFYSEAGLSAWIDPAVTLALSVVGHALRARYRRGQRINTRAGRESPPDPELDHVVQLMRGFTRVQIAVSLVVAVGLVLALWLLR